MYLPIDNPKINVPVISIIRPALEEKKPEPRKHTVIENDNLTKISELYNAPVTRLWSANPELANPDQITPGMVLNIPENTDVLASRPLPAIIPVQPPASPKSQGFSYANTYSPGNCTFYVASRRPVPNNLGNADSWLYRAKANGMATGNVPKPGAVAVAASYRHVAIVEQVDGNRILVSEMNYKGYGIVSSRWTYTAEWQGYVY